MKTFEASVSVSEDRFRRPDRNAVKRVRITNNDEPDYLILLALCGQRGGDKGGVELTANEARELAAYLNAAAESIESVSTVSGKV
jgi:hypothetical protein